jgi:uncharacterized membrane protein YvbJ
MICPSCGAISPDESSQCPDCGYKFRWEFALKDPKKLIFPNVTKSNAKKLKIISYLSLFFILILIAFAIMSSL